MEETTKDRLSILSQIVFSIPAFILVMSRQAGNLINIPIPQIFKSLIISGLALLCLGSQSLIWGKE